MTDEQVLDYIKKHETNQSMLQIAKHCRRPIEDIRHLTFNVLYYSPVLTYSVDNPYHLAKRHRQHADMPNQDVRKMIKDAGFKLQDVAIEIGRNPTYVSYLLQHPLVPKKRELVINSLNRLIAKKEETSNEA